MISLDDEFDGDVQVIKPKDQSNLEAMLEALEKKLSLLLESASKEPDMCGGPAETRTQDLCRVKAGGISNASTAFDRSNAVNFSFLLYEESNRKMLMNKTLIFPASYIVLVFDFVS